MFKCKQILTISSAVMIDLKQFKFDATQNNYIKLYSISLSLIKLNLFLGGGFDSYHEIIIEPGFPTMWYVRPAYAQYDQSLF